MGKGQNLKWYDLVYDNRELSNEQFAILVAVCRWEPNGNVKLMAGFGQAQILIVYRGLCPIQLIFFPSIHGLSSLTQ